MKSTDCIRVPAGIIEYLMGEAQFALKNGTEVDAYLRRLSVTGTPTDDEKVEVRAASMVANDHVKVIVDALQKIIDGAES